MNRYKCKAACRLHLIFILLFRIGVILVSKEVGVGVVPAHSIKSFFRQAVRQVVFTVVQ
jgi:adenosyl cobinamide kinase/adenosyl cobinamide phosphate guanylyltransferase